MNSERDEIRSGDLFFFENRDGRIEHLLIVDVSQINDVPHVCFVTMTGSVHRRFGTQVNQKVFWIKTMMWTGIVQ